MLVALSNSANYFSHKVGGEKLMGEENKGQAGWKDEANDKMQELQSKVPLNVPKDVRGKPLAARSTSLSRQASKVNLGFDNTPVWSAKDFMEEVYRDYEVNVNNIIDPKARPTFQQYLITQVMPTLTQRYTDLLNSAMHHEIAIEANKEMVPLTRVEAEKLRELLDKSTEAVLAYLRSKGLNNVGEAEQKWKAARNWLKEVFSVLPSGEGVYNK